MECVVSCPGCHDASLDFEESDSLGDLQPDGFPPGSLLAGGAIQPGGFLPGGVIPLGDFPPGVVIPIGDLFLRVTVSICQSVTATQPTGVSG